MTRGWLVLLATLMLVGLLGVHTATARQPEGTLTVAVATFGSERWLLTCTWGRKTWCSSPCTKIS